MNLSTHSFILSHIVTKSILIGVLILVTCIITIPKLPNPTHEASQPDRGQTVTSTLTMLPKFGQTFVPLQAGLTAIELPLTLQSNSPLTLTLHLQSNPQATTDLRVITINSNQLINNSVAHFPFEPITDSFNQSYYFWLEIQPTSANATIIFYYGPQTSYHDGALYLNGKAVDSQAAFALQYNSLIMAQAWLFWLIAHIPHFLALIALSTLPGAVLLTWLRPQTTLNHIEWLALMVGLSLSSYPVLLLLTSTLGLSLGTWVLYGGLTLFFIAISYAQPITPTLIAKKIRHELCQPPIFLFWLIFILSAAVRVIAISGQEIPAWADSYHHTIISQLIADRGSLFVSWQPYAPINSFTYHFGFHTVVATYHWLTGTELPLSVLVIGQWFNLLTVLMAFLLGRQFGNNYWAGTFAAFITGLMCQYPMFYVNWGRYTQLAGQVILPTTMFLSWLALKSPQSNIKLNLITIINITGLALTHYVIILFYAVFIIPLLLLQWQQSGWHLLTLRTSLQRLAMMGGGVLILFLPWSWQLLNSRLWQIYSNLLTPKPNAYVQQLTAAPLSLFDYLPAIIVLFGIIGMIWGCWQHHEGIFLIAVWSILLFVIARPNQFSLPGAGVVTEFAVMITAYLPFSILAGFIYGEISQFITAKYQPIGWFLVIMVCGLSLTYLSPRLQEVNPANRLVTQPDLAAMQWIKQNLPSETTFWTNERLAYADTVVLGMDAGWWIPYLTGRKTLLPPMSYSTEQTAPPDLKAQIRQLYQQLQLLEPASHEYRNLLQQLGITHIYIGQQRGEVFREGRAVLNPHELAKSNLYQTIYQHDHVWIFALK